MKIEICNGSRCMMLGGDVIFDLVEDLVLEIKDNQPHLTDDDLEVLAVPCQQVCSCEKCGNDNCKEPIAIIDGELLCRTTSQEIMSRILEKFPLS